VGLCLAVGRMELRNYVRGVRGWRGHPDTLLVQAKKFRGGLQPKTYFSFLRCILAISLWEMS